MAHIPFAFSIHHFVNSVGSYAGFASIIGLAILVLLYFAQARETSTLRDRADEAEQRAAHLEARLAQASRAPAGGPASAVAQRPIPAARPLVNPVAAGAGIAPPRPAGQPAVAMAASAGAGAARSVAAAAALPAAPAGVGAPALSAATRLIPAPVAAQQLGAAAASSPATAASAASAAPASPPPATVAGGAALGAAGSNGPGGGTNGTSEEFAVALADPPPVAAPASLEPASLEPAPLEPAPLELAPEPLPRVQLRPGGAAQTRLAAPSPRRPPPPRSPSRVGRGVILLLTALGVVAVVAVLLIATSGGGGKTASSGGTPTTNAPSAQHRVKANAFNTSAVTVAVLNGTATAGAAARLSGQLAGFGYKRGPTTNAANQTQASTIVMYLAGHRNGAVAVARALKLPSSSVQAIDSPTQAIACPSSTSCAVDVVVTVGQDLAGK